MSDTPVSSLGSRLAPEIHLPKLAGCPVHTTPAPSPQSSLILSRISHPLQSPRLQQLSSSFCPVPNSQNSFPNGGSQVCTLLHSLSWASAGGYNYCVRSHTASVEPGSSLAIGSPVVLFALLLGEENQPYPFSLQKMPLCPGPNPRRAGKVEQGGSIALGGPSWGHQRQKVGRLRQEEISPLACPRVGLLSQLSCGPITALPLHWIL